MTSVPLLYSAVFQNLDMTYYSLLAFQISENGHARGVV
jgi:hypothetical protein